MKFITVTKPGIIMGNLITLSGGFFLASHGHVNIQLFFVTLIAMTLVIASGCVFNNYIDRDIDQLMERTKERVLVKGLISGKVALLYASLLGIAGLLLFFFGTNLLTTLIAITGMLIYVVVYSLWSKRKSIYGTLIGAIAGAVPPVAGYCAVTNRFDFGAAIVFSILFCWQIPHSYAINIYRYKDYLAAGIPVFPIIKNIQSTKISMFLYVIAFALAALLPTLFGYTGFIYFAVALCVGLVWLYFALKGFSTDNNVQWSRRMFTISILNITLLSVMMSVS